MKKVRLHVNFALLLAFTALVNINVHSQCSPDVTNPNPVVLPTLTGECIVNVPQATTTDFCDGIINGTTSDPLTYSSEGSYVVTWTFTDLAGNSTTATQNVVVDDVTAPVPNVGSLPDFNSQCDVNSLTAPLSTDGCVGTVVGITATTFPITAPGTTVVTWTYDDNQGNISTQTQNVIINDVTAPVPNAGSLANVNAECTVSGVAVPTATDNCSGLINGVSDVLFPITAQGSTVITWTFTDANGNSSTQNQTVVIDDTSDPVPDIANLPTVNSVCAINSLTAPTASDACSGNLTATTSTTFPITAQGTTTVIWTYDDGNGNFISQNQTVIINDDSSPVPSLSSLPQLSAECSISSLTAPTANDNCAGLITAYHDAVLPITLQGTTVVTWTFDDQNGNVVYQTQQVVINDVTPPTPSVASLPDVTVDCGATSLTSPSATDNCVGFVNVTNNAVFPLTGVGTEVVTWYYTDAAGNITAQNQNVIVQDVTPPVVDLSTLAAISVDCQLTSLVTPAATDECGSVTITNDATLPITGPGDYTIVWSFEDENGNITTETQAVTVMMTDACLDLVTVNDVITPNEDGKNDYWLVDDVSLIAGCNVQIFNRWGALVYETTSYDNLWNGKSSKDEVLPEGIYYYIISCNDEVSFKGYLTIIR